MKPYLPDAKLLPAFPERMIIAVKNDPRYGVVRFGERTKQVCAGLRERGILIRDRSHEFEGTARITAGTPEQMRECLNALESILKTA